MDLEDSYGVDTLKQESAVLEHFKNLNTRNPKKIVKFAKKLYGEVETSIQRKFCLDIIKADNPVKYLEECMGLIYDCANLIEGFIETGHHGMMFTGDDGKTVHPLKLNTRENWLKEGQRWDPEQEREIMYELCEQWMIDTNQTLVHTKILLFPKFGFSGVPRMLTCRLKPRVEGEPRTRVVTTTHSLAGMVKPT